MWTHIIERHWPNGRHLRWGPYHGKLSPFQQPALTKGTSCFQPYSSSSDKSRSILLCTQALGCWTPSEKIYTSGSLVPNGQCLQKVYMEPKWWYDNQTILWPGTDTIKCTPAQKQQARIKNTKCVRHLWRRRYAEVVLYVDIYIRIFFLCKSRGKELGIQSRPIFFITAY